MSDSILLVPFPIDMVEYVNIYCVLLLVEFMMSTGELVSEVKLSVFLLTLWFGVLVWLCVWVRLKSMSCQNSKLIYECIWLSL